MIISHLGLTVMLISLVHRVKALESKNSHQTGYTGCIANLLRGRTKKNEWYSLERGIYAINNN